MDETGQNMELPVKKPTAVWVFGIGNIVLGCYFLVRMGYGWHKIIAGVIKEPEKIMSLGGIFLFLILVASIGLILWLIVLGVGLLTMKRWARRGSVLFGWINVFFIIIVLVATIVSTIKDWPDSLRVLRNSMTIDNGLAVVHWIYMILLLIFMKTAKVKRAFAAAGEYVNL